MTDYNNTSHKDITVSAPANIIPVYVLKRKNYYIQTLSNVNVLSHHKRVLHPSMLLKHHTNDMTALIIISCTKVYQSTENSSPFFISGKTKERNSFAF